MRNLFTSKKRYLESLNLSLKSCVMKKKKLQLEELKVKSFVTVVNKEEQRTAKGGYVYKASIDAAMDVVMDTVGGGHWTSEKTRLTGTGSVLARFDNNTKSKG